MTLSVAVRPVSAREGIDVDRDHFIWRDASSIGVMNRWNEMEN